jgi:SAM-dependent methyltransferase
VGRNAKQKKAKKAAKAAELKLDLGCGKNPRPGFEGVDILDFGQKHKVDLRKSWPWKDDSVDEANCSHFIEHLGPDDRIHFVNELYRVLKPEAKCQVVTPHWASGRAYGDLTHKWPPVAEFWFYYLSKTWREENAPHNDAYTCDFVVTWGYSLHQALASRNQEYQANAITWYKEAAQDTVATFVKQDQ